MAFDPTFQGIPTMFPSTSVLIPPPQNNPLLNPTNIFHHFQDRNPNPALPMQGLSSVTNPFNVPSIFCMGDSSQAGSLSGFVNPHINPMALAPNNKMEALYGDQGSTSMWVFDQKSAIQSSIASASSIDQVVPLKFSQPPPPVDSDEIELLKRALHEGDLSYLTKIYDIDDDGEKRKITQDETDNCTANITKWQWSEQEDKALVELVKQYGQSKWSKVAKLMKKRNGKQCRERWHNHLRPEIMKGPWTIIEDIILIKSHQKLGNKWEEIAKTLPGRSANNIRSHWNSAKRRQNIFKKQNNTPETYEGSKLQAYVERVTTAAKEARRETNEPINTTMMVTGHEDEVGGWLP